MDDEVSFINDEHRAHGRKKKKKQQHPEKTELEVISEELTNKKKHKKSKNVQSEVDCHEEKVPSESELNSSYQKAHGKKKKRKQPQEENTELEVISEEISIKKNSKKNKNGQLEVHCNEEKVPSESELNSSDKQSAHGKKKKRKQPREENTELEVISEEVTIKKKHKKNKNGQFEEDCKEDKVTWESDINSSDKKAKHLRTSGESVNLAAHSQVESFDIPGDFDSKQKKKCKKNKSKDDLNCHDNTSKKSIGEEEIPKKKKKNKLDHQECEETIQETNDLGNKGNEKIKLKTAKFNTEEAAVTEEEINQFVDEIDEEHNKQYENWVQLLEATLGPCRK